MTDDRSRTLNSQVDVESLGYRTPVSLAHPPPLDDRDWLARRYAETRSDAPIARELGCSPGTVRLARRRHGIENTRHRRPSERRQPSLVPDGETTDGSLAELADRLSEDRRTEAPATDGLLVARLRGLLDAKQHHDQLAIEDVLLSIASAALLVHEHQVKLRTV